MVTKKSDDMPEGQITPGYAGSGESLWSRHASKGHNVDTKPTYERMTWSRLDVLIKHERQQVAKLERRTHEARGTPKHAPLCVKLQRLRAFLRKLETEQRGLASCQQ